MTATAMVHVAEGRLERAEFPLPAVGDDDVLLRVEACGICGTDVERYRGRLTSPLNLPLIPGHEPVGVVETIGETARVRRGLEVGDRVAVDPFVACGTCASCLGGRRQHCPSGSTYGRISADRAPALWGGYATHLYLPPMAVTYHVPNGISARDATLYNSLGAGIAWGVDATGITTGSTVAVLGAGQRGLACVAAAASAGAAMIVVTGLRRDLHKLELARELGATAAIDVEADDVVDTVLGLTGGTGVDAVVDTTPRATQPVHDALRLVRPGGTIVLGGLKGTTMDKVPVDAITLRDITVRGVKGVSPDAYRRALTMLAAGSLPVHRLRTHDFSIEEAALAIETLADEDGEAQSIGVVLLPGT